MENFFPIAMDRETKHFYAFGPFRLDAEKRVLVRGGVPVPLAPKAADTLLLLVKNAGHLVEKDELMRRSGPTPLLRKAISISTSSSYGRRWGSGMADASI
jgi:DNA-binding response OmpR family regulator